MSSSFGNILKVSIFGESHSPYIGITIDNYPCGVEINLSLVKECLKQRRPSENYETSRVEDDEFEIISGYFNNHTTGTPLTILVKNKDVNSNDYVEGNIRPSHADYTYFKKYEGNNDYRGGGFSSGRLTVLLVILGSLCNQLLLEKGINIESRIESIHGEKDEAKIKEEMQNARDKKDSVGGIIETTISGIEPGVGEPFFDSLESCLSHLLFSIGGVKGVLFGDGMDFANKYGSELKDELRINGDNISFKANHNGGINGGISNGQPIVFKTIVKPTPSIGLKQESINLKNNQNIDLEISGRHDACIVPRVLPVVNAVSAYAILDLMMLKASKELWKDLD